MGAVDPTYPLFPIANVVASAMLLMVFVSSFVRHNWNLGVTFLCFWLLLENVTNTVDAIVWSDNYDIKLYVYCDIDSRLRLLVYFVKPMATLIITRRLYLIVSLQSVEPLSKAARRWDLAVEWTLGFILPLLIAGPIYYINQSTRFEVIEGFGCTDSSDVSILEVLIEESWAVIPPLVSIIFYYPKLIRTYIRQRKDTDSFLSSNSSVSRTTFVRILVLASIDILFTLPIGIVNITLIILYALAPPADFPFYSGWTFLHHADWEPQGVSYADMTEDGGTANLAQIYFTQWTNPALAFVIFGLFGLTSEARAAYWRIICAIGGWFGWQHSPRARNGRTSLGEIEFGAHPQDTSRFDLETGSHMPSSINSDTVPTENQSTGYFLSGRAARESETELKSVEEARCKESSGSRNSNSSADGRSALAAEESSEDRERYEIRPR